MIKTINTRVYPTKKQEKLMLNTANCVRFVYNWTINLQSDNYKNGIKFMTSFTVQKIFTEFKKQEEFKWLNNIGRTTLNQSIDDACTAYKMFFKGINGYPKYKKKNKSKLSFYVRAERLKPKYNTVNFENIGRVKIKPNIIPEDKKLINPRCIFDGKYWILSVGIEVDEKQVDLNKDLSLGVDLGIKSLAILSNGIIYENINKTNEMKRLDSKLRRLQKSLSRKYENNKKGDKYFKTKNIIKLEKEISLIHRRIANIRKNHIHTLTSDIIKMKPYRVVIEDLNIKGMIKNRHLSRAISQQCFYEVKRQLIYKCKFNGIELILANRFFPSSKTCSSCGSVKKDLKLSDRNYICNSCGLIIDRDLNASINLANYTV